MANCIIICKRVEYGAKIKQSPVTVYAYQRFVSEQLCLRLSNFSFRSVFGRYPRIPCLASFTNSFIPARVQQVSDLSSCILLPVRLAQFSFSISFCPFARLSPPYFVRFFFYLGLELFTNPQILRSHGITSCVSICKKTLQPPGFVSFVFKIARH